MIAFNGGRGFLAGRVLLLLGAASTMAVACANERNDPSRTDDVSNKPGDPAAQGTAVVVPPAPPGAEQTPGKRMTNSQRWAARKGRPAQSVGTNLKFAGINQATAALAPLAAGPVALATMSPDGQPDLYGVGNWANSPLVQISGYGAAAVAQIDNVPKSPTFGQITGVAIVAGGAGYQQTPTVTFTGGGGIGAKFVAEIDTIIGSPTFQQVIGFTKISGGAGYVSSPDVWIEGAPVPGTGVRKFVDGLPGLCGVTPGSTNNLGQCLPIATKLSAAATAAKGVPTDGDYYEIGLFEYSKQLHSDLPVTKLRGYKDLNPAATTKAVQYFGPFIIANKNRPVRVRFKNSLPVGPAGDLFIPVDTTFAGAGNGPDGTPYSHNRANLHLHGGASPWISDGTPHQWTAPAGEAAYTNFMKGVSTRDVPDMPPSAAGEMTLYWTNQQSERLMWYHDHTQGLTRLNVYAGEAAGYLLVEPEEEDSLGDATVPGVITSPTPAHPVPVASDLAHFLPLVIQDKTFTPDNGVAGGQLAATDPTWNVAKYGGKGQLWFPHVYTPNQNPADITGANGYGRWDYGAWFWPAQDPTTFVADGKPFRCPSSAYPDAAPPAFPPLLCPGTPRLSGVPESFMDTPIVNGTAYPSMTIEPSAYRFQMLIAGNDRTWNFGLYYAATKEGVICKDNAVADLGQCTEVSMVPASPHNLCTATVTQACQCNPPFNPAGCIPAATKIANCSSDMSVSGSGLVTAKLSGGKPLNNTGLEANCWPSSWPTDGRDGGVPDPLTAGPPFIQIGAEGGLLPAPVVIPSTPIGYEYNRRVITVLNILDHGLLLGPAERADVVVDFSSVPSGSALILYNDAPAPAPGFDARVDYYTGNPDQSPIGGAPSTPPGYGPNTRTVMQIKVKGASTNRVPFSLPALTAALPDIFAKTQDPIILPQTAYPPANGGAVSDTYTRIQDANVSYFSAGGPVGSLKLTAGGTGYTTNPAVTISAPACAPGPTCKAATATATAGSPVASVTLSGAVPGGSGYTTTPNVTVAAPACVPSDTCAPASAEAVLNPTTVAQVKLLNPGQNFSSLPKVSIAPPGCIGCRTAKASAVMTPNGDQIAQLLLDDPGTGYRGDPAVTISGGGGTDATAEATLAPSSIASINVVRPGVGYTTAPAVTIAPPGGAGQPAQATAALGPGVVLSVDLVSGGAGYSASQPAPTVTFTGGGGNGAAASATGEVHELQRKAIQELFTLDYGRMNATLGVELRFTNFNTQTTIPYGYADPPTELVKDGETQFWKVTHNGVDTHFIHFHLFTVQVVNRVGWDGQIKAPNPNELGWKDTVRMNPLEDVIVAIRPYKQTLPWALPVSVRALDVTKPVGAKLPYVFGSVDPGNEPATVTNDFTNFGFEYIWHCHILGHEENDMMRSIGFVVPPAAPTAITAALVGPRSANVSWTTNGVGGETNFVLQRATSNAGPWTQIGPRFEGNASRFVDASLAANTTYYYRVVAENVVGYTKQFAPPAVGWPISTATSEPSSVSAPVVVP